MQDTPKVDWDPRSEPILKDQIAAFDIMRKQCPVANSQYGYTSIFKHQDVMQVVLDHDSYSNAVSRFRSVPHGMDPPEHTAYRRLVESYFSKTEMDTFKPVCRNIIQRLVDTLPTRGVTELMTDFADTLALQIQCAFMGWPEDLHEPLQQWVRKNHQATLSGDDDALSAVAFEFDGYIKDLLEIRRQAGTNAPDDNTTRLLREQLAGSPLTTDEIVSIIRNWTVGELGSISASIGILVHYLAENPGIQQQLRDHPHQIIVANDEILRMHGPMIMNRRITTKKVHIRGRDLATGTRLAVIWPSANRDEEVFGDPDEFRLDRDPALNLLYGAGIHVCPGAPLARLELQITMQVLLQDTYKISLVPDQPPSKAHYPASGFASLPLYIEKT